MLLVTEIYKISKSFPKDETYGLVSQMRRCSITIPSNIAEGKTRGTRKDYRHFIVMAYASGAELETQIELSKRLYKHLNFDYTKINQLLLEIMKMLNSLTYKLNTYEPKT